MGGRRRGGTGSGNGGRGRVPARRAADLGPGLEESCRVLGSMLEELQLLRKLHAVEGARSTRRHGAGDDDGLASTAGTATGTEGGSDLGSVDGGSHRADGRGYKVRIRVGKRVGSE